MSGTAGTLQTNGSKGAQPTIDGSVYLKPQDMLWEPTQFDGISQSK